MKQLNTLFSVHFGSSCHFSNSSAPLKLKISALTTPLFYLLSSTEPLVTPSHSLKNLASDSECFPLTKPTLSFVTSVTTQMSYSATWLLNNLNLHLSFSFTHLCWTPRWSSTNYQVVIIWHSSTSEVTGSATPLWSQLPLLHLHSHFFLGLLFSNIETYYKLTSLP